MLLNMFGVLRLTLTLTLIFDFRNFATWLCKFCLARLHFLIHVVLSSVLSSPFALFATRTTAGAFDPFTMRPVNPYAVLVRDSW